MKIVASNSITVSNVNDGSITHTAWAYSADGTDGFTTVYPNLNLLDGTKDFSGNWDNASAWVTDGTYKGLAVKKRTGRWQGLYKTFTAPKDGKYTFSAYIKSSGGANAVGVVYVNGWDQKAIKWLNNDFDWKKDETTVDLKAGDVAFGKYEIGASTTDCVFWVAGHKWEEGSTATPYMQSASEVTTADWPKYIGHYTDFMQADSTNPSDYTWSLMRGNDGISPTVKINPDTSLTIVDAQGTITTPALKGSDGTSGIIVSSVAPASPQTGQLWQDTSTTPQLIKKWTGSSWVIWEFYAQNLKADSLETVSSKIGALYNAFTLEDGTTGTLHIGNSEYRINSQTLQGGYLFKENIFFDPDGLSFNFEGDTTSNSGHGSYRKSGSDFSLLNKHSASYTVDGISMSHENAGYRIEISNLANSLNKMSFVSENGQGFEFTGPVSFNGITSQDTPWITLSSGVKYKFMFSRMYISVNIVGNGSDYMQFGTIPQKYRPILDQFMTISNWGAGTADDRHMMVRASDGAVVLWAPKSGITYGGEVSYTL